MSIEYQGMNEATARLSRRDPLTQEEARALLHWVNQPLRDFLPRVQMDLALQQIEAINRFNMASGKLAMTAICVSAAQVIVGLIALVIAFHR